jgi:CelD/BcsL family acetyltransferase involved in cellulose biosynthesis
MKIHLIRPGELSADLLAVWNGILDDEARLDSPYFTAAFMQAVASVRPDVEVAVLDDGRGAVGFFPFQRGRWGIGHPVGGRLSDFQAVIASRHTAWSPRELLRGCRLSAWQFDHLLTFQAALTPFHATVEESSYIDLGQGFDAYAKARRSMDRDSLTQTLRKRRKLEREVGPVTVVAQSRDESVLDRLLAWKSTQYRATGVTDVFAFPWTVALVKAIWRTATPPLAGMLSAVYAGDQLLAAHFGMRSGPVVHWWFPAHSRELGRYSPGLLMLLALAETAEGLGIRRLDLGKGSEQYKRSFATGAVEVAEGAVDFRPLASAARSAVGAVRRWARSPAATPVRIPVDWLRKLRDRWAFR